MALEYEHDEFADDDEDEPRIRAAENRAMKAKKTFNHQSWTQLDVVCQSQTFREAPAILSCDNWTSTARHPAL
uniref:Uncharacterized protein n=1 Tax=Romanomermis culicivorax TaxID=13658 RepID=A0A915IK91_ROMCU